MAYDIKRLPSEASVDHDHEASLHDIKRLPSEASVDARRWRAGMAARFGDSPSEGGADPAQWLVLVPPFTGGHGWRRAQTASRQQRGERGREIRPDARR